MSRYKKTFCIQSLILNGSVTSVSSKCGKHNCACKDTPPKLHGPYYRWTGVIDGKRTTRTIDYDTAMECERRIKNYNNLMIRINKTLLSHIKKAPWIK